MISYRLTDNYVMIDLFSFDYDLLQSFCSICKSFLLVSFMNENEVFPFKKKKNQHCVKHTSRRERLYQATILYEKAMSLFPMDNLISCEPHLMKLKSLI